MVMKKIFLFIFYLIFFLAINKNIYARDYLVDYQIEYQPIKKSGTISTLVNFNIKITHLRSDIYVDKFKLIFPKDFNISGIEAKDSKGKIDVKIEKVDFNNEITVDLANPNVGKDTVNYIYLTFFQEKIFKEIGNIIEAFIPTADDEQINSYQVMIRLPKNIEKKISLAKPLPTEIKKTAETTLILWNNPKEKAIYAVLGEEQYYNIKLIYQLKNDLLAPVYQTIAFLPETSYQKVYIDNITPKPESVFLDDDRNLLGKYILLPKKSMEIVLEGSVVISNNANFNKINLDRNEINLQKNYLVSQTDDWQIKNVEDDLSESQSIYRYVIDKLDYNYQKVDQVKKRAKPDEILNSPKDAICLDYTDLFVALAREKGILTRAVIGYGFSQEERLRPVSLLNDILHSWPEYFDPGKLTWRPIDPTWQDTSGIDYFSSLDFNHIAFVILGKNSDQPIPAGMYKIDNQQKIFVIPTTQKPKEKIKLTVENLNFPKKIYPGVKYQLKLTIKNQGNGYLYNIPIYLSSSQLDFNYRNKKISIIPPLGKEEIDINLAPKVKYKNAIQLISGKTLLKVGDYYQNEFNFVIIPFYFEVAIIFIIFSFLSGLVYLLIILRSRRKRKN